MTAVLWESKRHWKYVNWGFVAASVFMLLVLMYFSFCAGLVWGAWLNQKGFAVKRQADRSTITELSEKLVGCKQECPRFEPNWMCEVCSGYGRDENGN